MAVRVPGPAGRRCPRSSQSPRPGGPAAPQAKDDDRSILTNAGVEDGEGDSPRAWTSGATIPGVEYLWSREGHTGKASLCLKKTAQRYFPIAEWAQKVDRQGNRPRLRVSAWVKADGVTKAILDAQFVGEFEMGHKWQHAWAAYIGQKKSGDPLANPQLEAVRGRRGDPGGHQADHHCAADLRPRQGLVRRSRAEYTNDAATDPTRP